MYPHTLQRLMENAGCSPEEIIQAIDDELYRQYTIRQDYYAEKDNELRLSMDLPEGGQADCSGEELL